MTPLSLIWRFTDRDHQLYIDFNMNPPPILKLYNMAEGGFNPLIYNQDFDNPEFEDEYEY